MLPLVVIVITILIVVVVVVLSSTLKHVQYASSRPLKLSIRDLLWEAVTCTLESRNGQITIRCTATLQSIVSLQISLLFPWTVRGKSAARTRRVSTSTATKGHLKSCPGLPGTTPHDLVHDLRHHPQAEKNTTNKKKGNEAQRHAREGLQWATLGVGFASWYSVLYLVEPSPLRLPAPWPVFQPTGLHRRTSRGTQSKGSHAGYSITGRIPSARLANKTPSNGCLALATESSAPSPQREKNVGTKDY